ncbi:MAG: Ig-like domain-containing protein [Gemmatimonadota bacterium]
MRPHSSPFRTSHRAALPSLVALLLIAIAACAKIEAPPGGPPDRTPPVLLGTRPDSIAVIPDFKGSVEFQFDEVISEGTQASLGLGTSDLERLIILSPTSLVPHISWKRTSLAVAPREGWKPGRVYRIELRPGVMDIQRNRLDSGAVVTFSTGAPLPTRTLRGTVIDWQAGHPARLAMVEALLLPDSLSYRSLTDSSGHFEIGPLPRGEYLVYGVIDQNRNLKRDFRDNYDTTRVQPDSENVATLWAAPHDTVGPRLTGAAPLDSAAAELTFSQPLDPFQEFDSTNARVLELPDSTSVPVTTLLTRVLDDRIQTQLRASADSAGAGDTAAAADSGRMALDSARAAAQERMKQGGNRAQDDSVKAIMSQRPPLTDKLVVRVAGILKPGTRYVVFVTGVRNVSRVPSDSRQLLNIPVKPPPAADSLAASPDSIRTDSTRNSTRTDSIPPAPKP